MLEHELEDAVRLLAVAFHQRQVQHALIGGLAVGFHARPRATKDADFIVRVPALVLPGLLESLATEGFSLDVTDAIRRWQVDRFIAFYRGRVRVDWMQPMLPLYFHVLATAEPRPWLDTELRVATTEGVILTKMLSFRAQDQADIEALLIANRDSVCLDYIRREWSMVATDEELRTAWLEDAIARLLPRPTAE